LVVLLVVEPVPMLPLVPSVKMDSSYPLTLVAKLAQPTVPPVLKEIPSLPLPVPSVPPPIT
jgi:hypothetical protein